MFVVGGFVGAIGGRGLLGGRGLFLDGEGLVFRGVTMPVFRSSL